MVRMRNVLVMASLLALWLLAGCAGSEGLQEEVTGRRGKRRGSTGEEEGASARAREVEQSS